MITTICVGIICLLVGASIGLIFGAVFQATREKKFWEKRMRNENKEITKKPGTSVQGAV